MLVLEETAKAAVALPSQLRLADEREYGETRVLFLKTA